MASIIDESVEMRTLYASPPISDIDIDENSGDSETEPVTLPKAISLSLIKDPETGLFRNTKIILLDGDYRDSYRLDRGPTGASNIVIFEAKNPGKAVVSGSELAKNITDEGSGKFSLEWKEGWGLGSENVPFDFDNYTTDYNRRREMVFVDGIRLEQVLSDEELIPPDGKLIPPRFYVNEDADKIIFQPPYGITLSSNTLVEVAVRGLVLVLRKDENGEEIKDLVEEGNPLFFVVGQSNLIFRGLVFQHAACYGGPALKFWSHVSERDEPPDPDRFPSNILIDNCKFQQNNYEGLSLEFVKNFTVKNSVFDENGVTGAKGGHWFNGEWLDCQFTNNNWRGREWLAGHHAAGCKTFDGKVGTSEVEHVSSGVQFVRCRFTGNKALGFWQDYSGDNFRMDRCLIEDNISGMMREMTYGRFTVNNSVIRNNFDENVTLYASPKTTLHNCYIYGAKFRERSDVTQLYLVCDDRDNGGELGSFAYTTIKNCTIQADVEGTDLFYVKKLKPSDIDIRASFLDTLVSDHNRWWRMDGPFWRSEPPDNIDDFTNDWQRLTPPSGHNLDLNSQWEQAKFLSAVPDPTWQFPNGLYRVSPGHASSKALDVVNAWTDDEVNIQQWEWSGGENQRWQVEHVDGGYYRLIAWHSGKAADVQWGGSEDGTNVWQYSWNEGDAQRWLIESLFGEYYKLTPLCAPDKVLSVIDDPNDGANVEIQTWNGANQQQWQFLNP